MGTSVPGAAQFLALSGLQPSKTPGALQVCYSDIIDLTTTGVYVIIPPIAARMGRIVTAQFEIKTITSSTVSPTLSLGTNSASFNNAAASQTVAGLTTGAAESLQSITGATNSNLDLTTSGLQLNVTGGATATALTARLIATYYLVPV
jgi:hypothetical protein